MKNNEVNLIQEIEIKLNYYHQQLLKTIEIADKFENLENEINHLKRGYKFQKLIFELLSLYNYDPKNLKLKNEEEIDIITQNNTYYEVKWEKNKISPRDIIFFHSKLTSRPSVRGIFISISGFSKAAIKRGNELNSSRALILIDKDDLKLIFNGDIRLDILIEEKYLHNKLKKEVFVPGKYIQKSFIREHVRLSFWFGAYCGYILNHASMIVNRNKDRKYFELEEILNYLNFNGNFNELKFSKQFPIIDISILRGFARNFRGEVVNNVINHYFEILAYAYNKTFAIYACLGFYWFLIVLSSQEAIDIFNKKHLNTVKYIIKNMKDRIQWDAIPNELKSLFDKIIDKIDIEEGIKDLEFFVSDVGLEISKYIEKYQLS